MKFWAWTNDYMGVGPVASLLIEDLEITIFGVYDPDPPPIPYLGYSSASKFSAGS
jgi:hypothetical protein